jgi:hypothetical protein
MLPRVKEANARSVVGGSWDRFADDPYILRARGPL